jgi:hypothetical protein
MTVSLTASDPTASVAPQARSTSISRAAILASTSRFLAWLNRAGCASYDPYDLWGTRYGLWARKVYYRKGIVGTPLIAPILLAEFIWPGVRRLVVRKQRYATADAQLVLALVNLFHTTGERHHLERAQQIAEEMLRYSVPGYRGLCWGYPFDWQNTKGMWPRNRPYITCTPYCFEAFLALFDATGDEVQLTRAASIAEFVYHDLNDTPTGPGAAAGSYSPHDNSKVINASAYRAFVMTEAAARFDRDDYQAKAELNLRFILDSQKSDGAWLYEEDYKPGAFIDHFHTCFVLKNLSKLNRRLQRDDIRAAINRGFDYYQKNLFHADGDPRSFAIEPRFQLARLEMYNFAEAITLGALLSDENTAARAMVATLTERLIEQHQLPAGYFVTRVFRGGFRHTFPFLRWPQAQLFLALTNALLPEGKAKR